MIKNSLHEIFVNYKYQINGMVSLKCAKNMTVVRFSTCRMWRLREKDKPILLVHEALEVKPLTNQDVCVRGWVKSIRKMGKKNTFIDIVDGLSPFRLQVVSDTKVIPEGICFHSAVSVVGVLVKSNHKAQDIELQATIVDLINPTRLSENPDSPLDSKGAFSQKQTPQNEEEISGHHINLVNDESKTIPLEANEYSSENDMVSYNLYPFAPRKRYSDDYCRMFPQYRSKLADFGCVLRIRSAASEAIHNFFLKR